MQITNYESFNSLVQQSLTEHWNLDSLSDYGQFTYQYQDVARIITKMHILMEHAGIKPGDRVALCGRNCSRWGIAFLSTLTYGAVAVPILHEFHADQVEQILTHSDAKMLFLGDTVWNRLKQGNFTQENFPELQGIVSLVDYSLIRSFNPELTKAREELNRLFGEKFPYHFRAENLNFHQDQPDELAIINYTSGTTSKSKGVMIPYRAICSNMELATDRLSAHLKQEDKVLSMLPMAHMYGMAFEFLYEFLRGVKIHFLTAKAPSPSVLMKALCDIQPKVIIVVPLVIEKIVKKQVLPKLTMPMRVLMKMPVLGEEIRNKIRERLYNALGGNFYEMIIGGAALNQEVENILRDINFPFAVGYGATECAPIITFSNWENTRPGSCGQAAPNTELQIASPDPLNIPGEILVSGKNVMLGYYKNEEQTAETLTDGWYHTGDMGIVDNDGYLYIKGRCKNMLLSANGQNIYPEEIEDKLNNFELIQECLVVQRNDKLVAIVYADPDYIRKQLLSDDVVEQQLEQIRKTVNQQVAHYEQLAQIERLAEEFEHTPKRSIKRYLYK